MALVVKAVEVANNAAMERALRTKQPAIVYISFTEDLEINNFCIAGEEEEKPEGYEELGKMIPSQERGIEWSCRFLYAIADYE